MKRKSKVKAIAEITNLAVMRRRKDTLDTAMAAVCGDRHLNYGSAEDNFTRIAELYNAWMHIRKPGDLNTQDVTTFNILQKLARLANTPNHFDSWADIAGYAACGAECTKAEKP